MFVAMRRRLGETSDRQRMKSEVLRLEKEEGQGGGGSEDEQAKVERRQKGVVTSERVIRRTAAGQGKPCIQSACKDGARYTYDGSPSLIKSIDQPTPATTPDSRIASNASDKGNQTLT